MFSRTERQFLELLVGGAATGRSAEESVSRRFPRAGYRRKLLWSIRRKATDGLEEWTLYAKAAKVEPRLRPDRHPPTSAEHPVFEDSIAALVRRIRGRAPPNGAPRGIALASDRSSEARP